MSCMETYTSYEDDCDWNVGECYVCGHECNISSQTCGSCARKITMSALGWYTPQQTKPKNNTKNKQHEE